MPATTTRQIGGVLLRPDAVPFANVSLTILRDPRAATGQGGAVVVDEPLNTQTGPEGQVSVALLPGKYLGQVRLSDADRYFQFAVPDTPGPFLIGDLLTVTDVSGGVFMTLQDLTILARASATTAAAAAAASGRLEIVGLSQLSTFVYSSADDGQRVVAEGDRIVDRASGAGYEVLAPGATSDVPGYTVKVAAQVAPAEYTDRSFGIAANGATDDAARYARMAAVIPAGKTLRLVGPGERIIGSALTFAQEKLRIIADRGVTLKQAAGTPTIDTLLTVSGARSEIHGLVLDANRAGNPTSAYTGRGELLKLSGARQVLRDAAIIDGHVKPFATGVYIMGNDCTVDGLTGYGTGRILIRGRADRPTIRNVVAYDVQSSAAHSADTFVTGNKVLVWDGGSETGDPFTWLEFDGIKGFSDSAGFIELIVVDSSTEVGGRIIARNMLANFPNSIGPDVIKFVNFKRLDIDGLTTFHVGDGSSNASLRLQHDNALAFSGRRSINLRGLDLAGHVNLDEDTEADIFISGGSQIGRDIDGPVCVDDLPFGTLTVEDGTQFRNFTTSVLGSRNDARFPTTRLGRCLIQGAVSDTASSRYIAQARLEIITTQPVRVRAGMLSIDEPLEITNTRIPADGRWIFDADARDVCAMQRGEFRHSGTDFDTIGPRDCENWQRGMRSFRRDPSTGQASTLRCVTGGASCQTAWVGSTAYTAGTWRFNGANVYVCATSGTSAASGGPTGTGTEITDGTAQWNFVGVMALWSVDGQISIQGDTAANIANPGAGINTAGKFAGKLVRDTTNNWLMVARGPAAGDVWDVAGQVSTLSDTAANIANIGTGINTTAKYAGKLVRDTTNNRLMIARGSAANSIWDVVDGSASVTPA